MKYCAVVKVNYSYMHQHKHFRKKFEVKKQTAEYRSIVPFMRSSGTGISKQDIVQIHACD